MLSSPSNLYAEKIFAEHPSALWALDENVDYLQLISEESRLFENWDIDNAAYQDGYPQLNSPFPDSNIAHLYSPQSFLNGIGTAVAISPNILNTSILNRDLNNFSVSSYVYIQSQFCTSVELGYEYTDESNEIKSETKRFSSLPTNKWLFLSETFDLPISSSYDIRLVVKLEYLEYSDPEENSSVLINGLSVGQWSEEFMSSSLGTSIVEIPADIPINAEYGVSANTYGLEENPGYYIASTDQIYAKNSGIPLVYGSSGTTFLYPNDGPSLIIPSLGFLSDTGKQTYKTLEFWMRVNSDTYEERRIVGPISSDDGLYISGPFIKIKIGSEIRSCYVGEWARPMLVNFRFGKGNASLILNGEEIINFEIPDTTILPDKLNEDGLNQEWLGFYAYHDVNPFEIDCIAIYSYLVPALVAKRRWVYGQGVEFPENINTAYSGSSVLFDYQFANYSANYNYPDIGSWSDGKSNNLNVTSSSISIPEYDDLYPNVTLSEIADWRNDNFSIQDEEDSPFIKLYPNSSWESQAITLSPGKLSDISKNVVALYGFFRQDELGTNETLFCLYNESNGDSFSVRLSGNSIDYVSQRSGLEEIIFSSLQYGINQKFAVGLHIKRFINYFGGSAAEVLGNSGSLKLYIGSMFDGSNAFSGRFYGAGISNEYNVANVQDLFGADGILNIETEFPDAYDNPYLEIDIDGGNSSSDSQLVVDSGYPVAILNTNEEADVSLLEANSSTYKAVVTTEDNSIKIMIGASSSWRDYVPLSYFASDALTLSGDTIYKVDFIQFNINYPSPSVYKQTITSNTDWTYSKLAARYAGSVANTYDDLATPLFSGYQNYLDLANDTTGTFTYDTTNSLVKTYISFHPIVGSSMYDISQYSNINDVPQNGTIYVGSEWTNTLYEIVDNVVIYPPKDVAVSELAIMLHVNIDVDSTKDKPIKINSLQLAARAADESSPTSVGTKFGIPAYPYAKSGIYYNYKTKNPFTVYKGSTPYLYLTRKSGITVRGTFDRLASRGIAVPINQFKLPSYQVVAMQFGARYDGDFFAYGRQEVFNIQSKEANISFYMEPIQRNGKRAKIYAINNSTGQIENGIGYYLNGKLVKNPVISVKEWSMIGINFAKFLNLSSYVGYFNINGPLTVSNISYYESTSLQQSQQVYYRPWIRVRENGPENFDWIFWSGPYIWKEVLVVSQVDEYSVSPVTIYQAYTGTNKIILGDSRKAVFGHSRYSILSNTKKMVSVVSPS